MLTKLCPLILKKRHTAACILWACVLLCRVSTVSAQAPYLRFANLGPEDGLSQGSVHTIFQDRMGFIWLGTQDGLNRWDGTRFSHFPHEPEDPAYISDQRIQTILQDGDGLLWVGTDGGTVDSLDPITGQFRRLIPAPEAPRKVILGGIRAMLWEGEHHLWVGGTHGLALLDIRTGAIVRPTFPAGSSPIDSVRCLDRDSEGRLLFCHKTGIGRILGPDRAFAESWTQSEIKKIKALVAAPDGSIWAGAEHFLIQLQDGRETQRIDLRELGSPSILINRLFFDRDHRMWVATTEGLVLRKPDLDGFYVYRKSITDTHSLSDDEIYTIFEDRSGMLWFGSLSGGVDRWHPASLRFGRYPATQTSKNDSTYAFATSSDGDLWIGTFGGLLRWHGDRIEPYVPPAPQPPLPQGLRVMSLLGGSQGRLWIGTRRNGLLRLNPETGEHRVFMRDSEDPTSLPDHAVMTLFENQAGTLFVGTSTGALARYDPDAEAFAVYAAGGAENELSSPRIPKIAETEPGTLWLAAYDDGLDHLDLSSGRVTRFRHTVGDPTSLPADSVMTLHVDGSGRLWLGTQGAGFGRLESGRGADGTAKFRSWNKSHGLPNDTVYGILSDHGGQIWLSTNRGLSRFDPGTETFTNFKPRHGLQAWEFNFGAYYRAPTGTLYFGGVNGFNRIRPQDLGYRPPPPPVALAGLEISNEPRLLPGHGPDYALVELGHEDTSISLGLAALDFWEPEANRYAYKLDGFDRDWIELEDQRPVVSYTNLDPGSYTFQAIAGNSEGVWNETGLKIPIRVAYAPWETWWAWCLYGAFAAGLLYAGVRWRLGALERRSEELKELVDLRTGELKDTVLQLQESESTALEAKRRALKSLEEALEERRRAQEADQAKSTFLSNMSHELRTPLNAVLGFAQLMERDPQLTAEHQESLKTILRSGEHLLSLINDVLSLAKIEAGRLTLSRDPFLLHRLCRDVEEMVRPRAEEKGLNLSLEIAQDVPEAVEGDSSRLIQILLNLLGNAVKFTAEGSVTLGITRKAHLIDFAVSDTGAGIPDDEMSALFEPFQQTEIGRAEQEGTGLGLAISERLVELMGGTLRVSSKVGQGSTFAFALPLPTVSADRIDRETRRVVAIGLDQKPPKILVADDAFENRELLRRLFEDVGLPVRTVSNGAEAVDVWREWRPSLIWMDMRMPEVDGYEATRTIRRAEAQVVTGRTVILALTAAAFEDDRREILASGCDDVVTKPYQEPILFEKMAQFLDLTFVYGEPAKTEGPTAPQGTEGRKAAPGKPAEGIRVLIAEDNPANQMVARRMLDRLGYEADVVANGHLALDAFAERHYPLVLMDIRMPKMDGITASRQLRESLPAKAQPSIIALTGLASEDERRMCLQAGMDDLLAKPFRIEDLEEMVSRWLTDDGTPRRDAQAKPEKAEPETSQQPWQGRDSAPLDRAKLDLLHQLDDGSGSQSLADQVIALFLDTVPGQLKELNRAIVDGDMHRWRRVAHSLKNSSATLGADAVSASCKTLESLSRSSDDPDEVRQEALPILDRLYREVELALAALAVERRGPDRPQAD